MPATLKSEKLLNPKLTRRRVGLGTALSAVITPVAAALGADCVDPATGKLKPESGCAGRVRALDTGVPNINPLAAHAPAKE